MELIMECTRLVALAILGNWVITLGFDAESGFEPWVFDRAGGGGQRLADIF
jgi:hypothetical protein